MDWMDKTVRELVDYVTDACIENGGKPTMFTISDSSGMLYYVEIYDAIQMRLNIVSGVTSPEELN